MVRVFRAGMGSTSSSEEISMTSVDPVKRCFCLRVRGCTNVGNAVLVRIGGIVDIGNYVPIHWLFQSFYDAPVRTYPRYKKTSIIPGQRGNGTLLCGIETYRTFRKSRMKFANLDWVPIYLSTWGICAFSPASRASSIDGDFSIRDSYTQPCTPLF